MTVDNFTKATVTQTVVSVNEDMHSLPENVWQGEISKDGQQSLKASM